MSYVKSLIIRVAASALLLTLPFNVFYVLLAKITLWTSLIPIYLIRYPIEVDGNNLLIAGQSLEFVSACVATSAYYLLALLVLLTKDVKPKTGAYVFLTGAFLIFVMNVARIGILLFILVRFGENWFDNAHIFFWQFVSTAYVALVWIFLTYKFKVKSIPVYSDALFLFSKSVFHKKRKR